MNVDLRDVQALLPYLLRKVVDFRFVLFVIVAFAMLFFVVRFHFGEKNLLEIAKSKHFILPAAILLSCVIVLYCTLYFSAFPRPDTELLLTVADFGYGKEGELFRDEINSQLRRLIPRGYRIANRENAVRGTDLPPVFSPVIM